MIEVAEIVKMTCIVIIAFVILATLRIFQRPIGVFLRMVNPFVKAKQIYRMEDRITELEMQRFQTDQEIKDLYQKLNSTDKNEQPISNQ